MSPHFRQQLASLIWPERWRLATGFGFLSGSAAISLALPRAAGTVLDHCLAPDPAWTPAAAAAALAAMIAVQAGMVAGRTQLLNTAGESGAAGMRRQSFGALVHKELSFCDETSSGALLGRLSADTFALQKLVTTHGVFAVRGVAMVGGCFGMMLCISPPLCAVSSLAFPPAVLIARRAGEAMKQRQAGVQTALAGASAEASASLLALLLVQIRYP